MRVVRRHRIDLLRPALESEIEQWRPADDHTALILIALDTGTDAGIDQGPGEGWVV
jgi:hypothetical protein